MFMVRRIECYVIKENDLLGTNSVCRRRRREKGVKRMDKKATRREEMWIRIIAKYISSIRDAFMGFL